MSCSRVYLFALLALVGCAGHAPAGTTPRVTAAPVVTPADGIGRAERAIVDRLSDLPWARLPVVAEGFFADGQGRTLPLHVPPGRCRVLVAIGTRGLADLDAVLYSPGGRAVATDRETDAHPTVAACAGERARSLYYRVSAYRGAGAYRVLQFEAPELRDGQLEEHLGGQPSVSRSVDDDQASALEQQMRGAERRGFVARGAPRDVPLEGAMRLRLPLPVDAGTCVSVLAIAHGALEGVDLVLRDEAGVARSEDLAPTRGAAVQACPRREGRWTIELSSSGGRGRAEVAVMDAQQSEVGAETALWWGARPAPERPRLTGRVISRGRLAPGEVRSILVPTPPGACVRVDAAGDPSLGAIELTPASREVGAVRTASVRGLRLCRARGAPAPRVRVSARGPGAYRLLVVSAPGD